jgi:hypothetical protein
VVEVFGFTTREPESCTAPTVESDADDAFCVVQESVEVPPAVIAVGLAVSVHAGCGVFTVTVA